jgi:hypothetical protein
MFNRKLKDRVKMLEGRESFLSGQLYKAEERDAQARLLLEAVLGSKIPTNCLKDSIRAFLAIDDI